MLSIALGSRDREMVGTEVIKDVMGSKPRELSLSCLDPLTAAGYGFPRNH